MPPFGPVGAIDFFVMFFSFFSLVYRYLPSEWTGSSGTTYPVIVEYMGNGPFNDQMGDLSSGRPEDSNLGWGFAQPAGSKYIWISMPFLSADLGNETEISTYWWGCPSSDAGQVRLK